MIQGKKGIEGLSNWGKKREKGRRRKRREEGCSEGGRKGMEGENSVCGCLGGHNFTLYCCSLFGVSLYLDSRNFTSV